MKYKHKNKQTLKRKLKTKTKTNTKTKTKTKKKANHNKSHTRHNHHHPHHSHHSHNTLIQSPKTLYEKQYVLLPNLKGGKFVDRGGYGCVVTPAISCSSTDINLDKSVSKIVKDPDGSDISTELKISNFLKKIDPLQKYFITYDNICRIHRLPKDRTDLLSVKYTDDEMEDYKTIENNKDKDKDVCDIEVSLHPINLIMKHAGNSLSSIMKVDRKSKGTLAKMHQLFIENFKKCFKHLIIGLIKMHKNKIVNRDIKQRNIMIKWNTDTYKNKSSNKYSSKNDIKNDSEKQKDILEIRYIDFGLSDIITSDMYKHTSNIRLKGTYFYISPELFISYIITNNNNRSRNYHMKKINTEINENVKKALLRINEKEILNNLNKDIDILYDKIKFLVDKDKILEVYFGSKTKIYNGYLQKGDVYALGISMFETLYHYSHIDTKSNKNLYDLLSNMIKIDPDKRYNAIQCLSHPYFTS